MGPPRVPPPEKTASKGGKRKEETSTNGGINNGQTVRALLWGRAFEGKGIKKMVRVPVESKKNRSNGGKKGTTNSNCHGPVWAQMTPTLFRKGLANSDWVETTKPGTFEKKEGIHKKKKVRTTLPRYDHQGGTVPTITAPFATTELTRKGGGKDDKKTAGDEQSGTAVSWGKRGAPHSPPLDFGDAQLTRGGEGVIKTK